MRIPGSKKGFTVVELIVVIITIGILAAITVVAYGAWQKSIAENALKSDLNGVRTAMDDARNTNDAFPSSIPSSFQASDGVTLTYVNGDDTDYCVEATSTKVSSLTYFLKASDKTTPKSGTCPPPSLPVPTLNTATVAGNQAQLAWSTVSGATSYEVQYRKDSGSWTVNAPVSSTNTTIGSLGLSATYDFQVRATNGSATSPWSNSLTRKTVPTPVITTASDLGCGNDAGTYVWLSVAVSWAAAPTAYTSSYRFEGTQSAGPYGYVPLTVANPTGSGTLSATTSTTQWMANVSSSGVIYLYGVGPNGELSSPATWASPVHPAYDC